MKALRSHHTKGKGFAPPPPNSPRVLERTWGRDFFRLWNNLWQPALLFHVGLPPASSIVISLQQHISAASDTRPFASYRRCSRCKLQPPTNVTGLPIHPSTRGRRPWLFWALIGVSALEMFGFAGGVRPIFNFKFHSCDGGEALVSEENPGVEGMMAAGWKCLSASRRTTAELKLLYCIIVLYS
jgi:hypothetical protein